MSLSAPLHLLSLSFSVSLYCISLGAFLPPNPSGPELSQSFNLNRAAKALKRPCRPEKKGLNLSAPASSAGYFFVSMVEKVAIFWLCLKLCLVLAVPPRLLLPLFRVASDSCKQLQSPKSLPPGKWKLAVQQFTLACGARPVRDVDEISIDFVC